MKTKLLIYGMGLNSLNSKDIVYIFKIAIEKKASDIFIIAGRPLS